MDPREDSTVPPPRQAKWRWIIVAAVILVLGYPIVQHLFFGTGTTAAQGNQLQISAVNYQNRQYQASIDAAREYLKSNPGSADAYNNIAVADLQLGQFDEAMRNVLEALRLNPNDDLAKRNLAWIVAEREKAHGGAAAVAQAPPAQAAALLNTSLQDYNARKFPECIASAKAALKVSPTYAEAYNNVAACESALKHYDAAIAAAQEALRLKPDFQLARNNLAWAIKERAGK
ncbi:MAG TPA: tetratricopeptide repeat protein [Bryobacteraceae bacterium]|nr:tetratricopeptide repeat protein [Bryobacteraceae bacterium]